MRSISDSFSFDIDSSIRERGSENIVSIASNDHEENVNNGDDGAYKRSKNFYRSPENWTGVYIRDFVHGCAWRPAELLNGAVQKDDLVAPVLLYPDPMSAPDPSILVDMKVGLDDSALIDLTEYPNNELPRRNKHVVHDLVDLEYLHEAGVLYNLRNRYEASNSKKGGAKKSSSRNVQDTPSFSPYTRIAPGSSVLIAVNPFHLKDSLLSSLYSDSKKRRYADRIVWNSKSLFFTFY